MKNRILCILLFYCCNAWSESNSIVADSEVDIGNIIDEIAQTQYTNTEQAKALAFDTLKLTLSGDNIKHQIQLYKILAELEIEQANYETAIGYYSTALSLSEDFNLPSLMLNMLNALTLTYQKNGAYDLAMETANRAIKFADNDDLILQKAVAVHNKGRIFHIRGEYAQAFEHFSKAEKMYQTKGNKKKLAQLLDDKGNTAIVTGEYQQAIAYFFEALNIHEDIDDNDGKAEINLDLGIVYSALGELTVAEKHFTLAINENPMGRESVLRNARVYFNLADLFSQSKDFHKAILFSKKSIESASQYDDQRLLTYAYLNLAEASIPIGHYAEAQLAINKCLEYTHNNNTPRLEIYTHLIDSRISVKNKDFNKAQSALLKSMKLAKDINAKESLLTVLKELSELYALQGDLANAYQYLLDYDQLKDKVLNEKNKRILFQEQEKFNTVEQQKTIIKLENEKLITSLQASADKVRNFLFISFIILLLITLCFVYLRYRQNVKSAAIINKTNDELRQAYIEIEHVALTDSLTLVKNRRAITINIQEHYLRFKRHQHGFCIILIDIDFFKSFNDTYGHHCGDMVLKEVAQCIKGIARESDEVARWGGEEFLVLLPNTAIEDGLVAAERTRLAVEALRIDYERPDNGKSQKLNLTITVGIADAQNEDVSADAIIARADKALYVGKDQGRNRVVCL